ncbi:ATP-binding cassette sub-family G member 2 [Fukomys damarensis]|uniref:ATP-binding cassette sub-family G member 2 n=1 Tax=Fukomys damarensis TaxID=885580 RepID=A0A091CYZ7_FUKDA|nr:ATP-binding cassette sub-family G member 2 [Fukomys damarensis]
MSSSDDRFYIPLPRRNTSGLSGMSSGELNMHSKGTVLSFHNISYYVKVKRHLLLGWKKEEKEVLSNIRLLDVLAARKHPEKLSGDVLINGEPQPANFKCYSGYVAEDEGIMGTLTVRENLQFSAALRLPTTMTQHEKNERMNDVIEELGLDKVADSKVGTELIHGVSKAESKKTRIAMELITHSSILFLDEPTNALDPSTAHAVFSLLKKESNVPRSCADDYGATFLQQVWSSSVYCRSRKQRILEESGGGYKCEPYNNPAEFFLDVISGVFTAKESDREEEEHQCIAWMFYVLIVSLCFNYESAIQLFLREKKLFIGSQFSWHEYINIPYYGLMALQHNEFLGQDFCPGLSDSEDSGCPNYVICSGEEFLTIQRADLSPWGLWKNHVVLAVVMIFFFTIAFLKLLFSKSKIK